MGWAVPDPAGDARMILTTDRLTLRRPGPQDADAAVAFFTSDRSAFVGGPLTPGKAWRHFAAEVGHWDLTGCGMWAVTVTGDDTAIGLIGPWTPIDWPEKEIGWVMFSGEGKGYAFEAAQAIVADAYTRLNWPSAVSYIDADNARSIRLAERLGATLDADAQRPAAYPNCLVYRHPKGVA